MIVFDRNTLNALPLHTYLTQHDVGIWALVYTKCPTCGAKCDKSHSGNIEFCCGHFFDPMAIYIKGLTWSGVTFAVGDRPAFMFTEQQ
jgi:hypothetical protein